MTADIARKGRWSGWRRAFLAREGAPCPFEPVSFVNLTMSYILSLYMLQQYNLNSDSCLKDMVGKSMQAVLFVHDDVFKMMVAARPFTEAVMIPKGLSAFHFLSEKYVLVSKNIFWTLETVHLWNVLR